MAHPEIAAIFEGDFVIAQVDVDRMTGGKDMQNRYQPKTSGGIPWFAILDAQGKALRPPTAPAATSATRPRRRRSTTFWRWSRARAAASTFASSAGSASRWKRPPNGSRNSRATDMPSEIGEGVVSRPRDLAAGEVEESAVLRKVALRILPFLFLLYIVNIVDRMNVGFAKLRMLEDLGLDEKVYGLGAGMFYVGYMLFEIPSNLILHRVGARRWISRIMISWGIISACMMFVRDEKSFYLLRILLGLAEAGFFPGIILYMSYWFPAHERARAVAWFMMASPLSGVLNGPISGALLEYTNTAWGLAGWQWLFLLEGIPAVILGFVTWWLLTDRPEQAGWLEPGERAWLSARMAREERGRDAHHGLNRLGALLNPRVGLLILLYFTIAVGTNGYGFFAAIDHRCTLPPSRRRSDRALVRHPELGRGDWHATF